MSTSKKSEKKKEEDDKDEKKQSSAKQSNQSEKKSEKKSSDTKTEVKKEVKKEANKETKKKDSEKKESPKSDSKKPAAKEKSEKKESKKEESSEEEEKKSMGMLVGVLAVLLLIIGGISAYVVFSPSNGTNTNEEPDVFVDIDGNVVEEDSPAAIIPRQIDGMMVAREDANEIPVCVMIENAAFGGVRPQSGLNSASVVYEVIVEGGITRFMAVFGGEESDEVGPIRSARDTYLEFASEYDCMYTHAGGSYTAMVAIPRFGLRDMDALREPQFFWRDSSRYAPHNLFSSTEKLNEGVVAHSWHLEDAPSYDSWNFVDAVGAPEEVEETEATEEDGVDSAVTEDDVEAASAETEEDAAVATNVAEQDAIEEVENGSEAVNKLSILFGGSYNVEYNYNAEGNYYERTNGNVLQTDAATGETLRTNNVVVMNVGAGIPIEGKGRINWPVTGEGEVQVYHDGRVYNGTWKKPSREERLQFYDADGELLPMVRGNTWVTVVPPHITVETE